MPRLTERLISFGVLHYYGESMAGWKIQMIRKGQIVDGRPVYIGVTQGKTRLVHMMPDTDPDILKEMNRAVKDQSIVELDIGDVHHYETVGV
jgi:hypothetical protein